MPFLIVEEKSGVTQRIQINSIETVIGRHPDCQVVVEDSSVSRKHAQIIKKDDGDFVLEDLKSRNGTNLNNRTIHQSTRLFDGDSIQICDVRFKFHLTEKGKAEPRRTTESSNSGDMSSISLEDDESGLSSIMSRIDLPSHHSRIMVSAETKLSALMEITRAMSSSVDLDEIMAKMLDCLFGLFVNADRGFIIVENENGLAVPVSMKIRNPNDDEKIRISRTIVKHVMTNKQALISSDAAEDDRFDLSQSLTDFRIRSIMCAPLLDSEQNAIGVIQLDTLRRSVAFKEEDLELLMTVGIQAGLAMENAKQTQMVLEQRDIQRDLELAHEVQSRLLPGKRPELENYVFFDYYRPANHVGGDYYDYIKIDENRVAIIVADVVGHGIAAALLMAKLSAEVRSALAQQNSASQAMRMLNQAIEGLNLDRFVTMVLGVLDVTTNKLTVVNAGHMQPIVRHSDGEIFEPDDELKDVPIGILDDATFPEYEIDLGDDDTVFMYTDGVNEAMDRDGKQFEIPRVIDLIKSGDGAPESTVNRVMTEVRSHMGEENQFDDICIVCFSRKD